GWPGATSGRGRGARSTWPPTRIALRRIGEHGPTRSTTARTSAGWNPPASRQRVTNFTRPSSPGAGDVAAARTADSTAVRIGTYSVGDQTGLGAGLGRERER